jgi:glycopeptide antibiotics resistance protein
VYSLYLLLLAVGLLWPFGSGRTYMLLSPRLHRPLRRNARDAVVNIALFLPIGFLGRRILRERRRLSRKNDLYLIAFGLAFSLTFECLQYFIPGRYSTLRDLAMNTLGTAAGVALEAFLMRPGQGR